MMLEKSLVSSRVSSVDLTVTLLNMARATVTSTPTITKQTLLLVVAVLVVLSSILMGLP